MERTLEPNRAAQSGVQVIREGTARRDVTGTAMQSGVTQLKTSPGSSLTIAGFDPSSGRIRWRQPADNLAEVLAGNLTVADNHSLLIKTSSKQPRILDLRTGRTTAPHRGQTFWCQKLNVFHIAWKQRNPRWRHAVQALRRQRGQPPIL